MIKSRTEYKRLWRYRNKNRVKTARLKYYKSHTEQVLGYAKKYHIEHREERRLACKIWREKNRDRNKQSSKRWKSHNKERVRIKSWEYHKKHPQYGKASSINYRARRKSAGELTGKVVQRVYEDNIKCYGTLTCYLCGLPIVFGQDCLEHKVPLARNGDNTYDNLGIAHRVCNNIKCTKTPVEYWMDQL